jgi:hypothetical protein
MKEEQMPGIVDMKGHDPRLDLEGLPDPNLFDIGRNPDAAHRSLAIDILVERCSKFICRPEIADEVEKLPRHHTSKN